MATWHDFGLGSGVWASDENTTIWLQDLKTILAELAYAVNEREMFIGKGDTLDDGSTFPEGRVSPWSGSGVYTYPLTRWPVAQTWLTAGVNATATTLEVSDGSILPAAPFDLLVEAEYVSVTEVDGNELTVVRHARSTSNVVHLPFVLVSAMKIFPAADEIKGPLTYQPAISGVRPEITPVPFQFLELIETAVDNLWDNGQLVALSGAVVLAEYDKTGISDPTWTTAEGNVENAALYEEARENIEKLRLVMFYPKVKSRVRAGTRKYYENNDAIHPSMAVMWATMLTASPTAAPATPPWLLHSVASAHFTTLTPTTLACGCEISLSFAGTEFYGAYIEGDVVKGEYKISYTLSFADDSELGLRLTGDVVGSPLDIPPPGEAFETYIEADWAEWETIPAGFAASLTDGPPVDNPLLSYNSGARWYFEDDVRLKIDQLPVFTYGQSP